MAKRQTDSDIIAEDVILPKKFKIDDENSLLKEVEEKSHVTSVGILEQDLNNEEANYQLTEKDVGIIEYVGNHTGFSGIIKQRFSDFLVNEIDKQGKVIHLDNCATPQDEDEEINLPVPEEYFEEEIRNNLKSLSNGDQLDPLIIKVTEKSKEDRRIVHTLISKLHPNLTTKTEDKEGEKVIIVEKDDGFNDDRSQSSFRKGVRQKWPTGRPNYTSFVLYKENIDTMEAVNLISRMLRMKPGVFTYCGVKDRRAKTVQQMTVYRTEAHKLLNLNPRLHNISIGNITFVKEPLRLGNLWGNRFNIVLRNVIGTDEEIAKAMNSLEKDGFLNFYGMQRFGTTAVPTFKVGLALLKNDWSSAVDLILQPRPGENENMTLCRNMWKEKESPNKILALMKKKNSAEAHLLRGLVKNGTKDLVGALNSIPRNIRLMYVHSYQSYVWNRVLTSRHRLNGTKTIEGDLYMKQDDYYEVEEQTDIPEKIKPEIVKSTDEPVSSENVVLPLFGHDILYPNNQIADLYKEHLAADGLDINDLKRKIKDYSLPGSYRPIIVKPKNIQWSLVKYDDPTVALIQSDWSKMQKESPPPSDSEGVLKAMKIQFDLPRSCYATMALREIMRIDTSSTYQKTLNPKVL